jgi:RHS repeat-associated protein
MQWGQAGKTRKYSFAYDNLSRLKTAAYTGESPTNFAASYTYDKHGNIKTLQRYGMTTASTYGIIDNLTAEYTGNQLKYVSDAVDNFALNSSMDFKEYTEGTNTEYLYNLNGAMYKDLNKGISAITYNSLNLPQMVDIKNMNAEGRNEYTYSASGQKLKAVQKWNPNYYSAPVIGSDINVSSLTMSTTTDYVGNIIYENNTLKRILVDGGYNEGGNYYFYINDHLGNNRIVANAAASVVQSTQYYPFGMPFADATGQNVQPYKYNNKELDGRNGLNWYDYSARYLALDFPVMPTVDPLAELHYDNSPYAYVLNNPIKYIDPFGMDTIYAYKDGTEFNRIEAEGDPVTIYGPSQDAVAEAPMGSTYSYYSYILSGMSTGATSAGAVNGYRQYTQYSQTLNIWRGQNGKIYRGLKGRGPNRYTGSRALAKAKAARIGQLSTALTFAGMFATLAQYEYDMKQNPGPNLKHYLQKQQIQDQLFNAAGFFRLYGTALSFGYNLGYMIENVTGQNIQFNPYTMDFTPIEETLTEFDNLGIYVY